MSVYKQLKYFRLPRLSNFRRVQARRRDRRRLHYTASLKQRTSVSLSLPARSHPSARKIGAVNPLRRGCFHLPAETGDRSPSKYRNKEYFRADRPTLRFARVLEEKEMNTERCGLKTL